jgi:anti-sigma factor RsiW
MIETICTYSGRDDLLIAYLYDDIEPGDRAAFSAHLHACGRCTRELAAMRGVRSTLSSWAPPEPARALAGYTPPAFEPVIPIEPRAARRTWHDVPGWAQVAAAVLVLGVSAAIANVEVRHDAAGWTLRTGWAQPDARSAGSPAPAATPTAAASPAPWRADLAALEQQLRAELQSAPARAVPAASPMSDAELQRRVRAIIDESERRQERELALRVAEVVKDVNAQRQADLVKIDRSLGFIQSSTYGEQMKQRELVNYLLKVSQKQ